MSGGRGGTDDPDREHERTVREVRGRFVAGLPERLGELRRTLDAIGGRPGDADRIREFEREAHNLAGTASSFGLPVLAESAASLEALAERWIETEEIPEDDPATARRHLERLERRCRELLERREDDELG